MKEELVGREPKKKEKKKFLLLNSYCFLTTEKYSPITKKSKLWLEDESIMNQELFLS